MNTSVCAFGSPAFALSSSSSKRASGSAILASKKYQQTKGLCFISNLVDSRNCTIYDRRRFAWSSNASKTEWTTKLRTFGECISSVLTTLVAWKNKKYKAIPCVCKRKITLDILLTSNHLYPGSPREMSREKNIFCVLYEYKTYHTMFLFGSPIGA